MKRKTRLNIFCMLTFVVWTAFPSAASGEMPDGIAETGGGSGTVYGIILMAVAGIALIVLAVMAIQKRKK